MHAPAGVREPASIAGHGIAEHMAGVIAGLPEPPILVGHSFGGRTGGVADPEAVPLRLRQRRLRDGVRPAAARWTIPAPASLSEAATAT